MPKTSEALIQRNYYAETASRYEAMHVAACDEHYVSLTYISAFLRQLGVRTVLDVGCGTGRAQAYLAGTNPEVAVYGIEPVPQLLNLAVEKGIHRNCLVNGSGLDLPFRSNSVDAVIECGVLHHVREPERVVREMIRVARKAIFLSDNNIFGQGRTTVRLLKLALYKVGLWKFVKLIQTVGKGYTISEGDGVAYSYSAYFQHNMFREWADRVFAVPVRQAGKSPRWWSPVLTADTVLLCALRESKRESLAVVTRE